MLIATEAHHVFLTWFYDGNETDSAYGVSSESTPVPALIELVSESETNTMKSSITAYRIEISHRYHAYKDGAYWYDTQTKLCQRQLNL